MRLDRLRGLTLRSVLVWSGLDCPSQIGQLVEVPGREEREFGSQRVELLENRCDLPPEIIYRLSLWSGTVKVRS